MTTKEEIISGKYKTFTLHLNGKNEKYMLYEDTLQAMESYRNQSSPMSEEEIREYVIKEYPFIENIYGNTEIWDNLIYRQVQSNIKFQSHLLSRVEDKKENLPMEEGDEDKYEKGKFIISDPYIQRIKDKFSGSVDYMSGVNDGLYSMFYGLMGYTEIVKILEKGLQGRGIDVRAYAEKYINDKPESVLVKPFKALLEGNTNPDKLTLLNKPIEDKPVTLGKNSFLDPYSPHAKWVTAQDAVNVKDKGEIQKLMEDWDEWRNKTFPNATPISHCIHLLKEVEELKQAIFHEHSKDEIGSEFADCFILLLNTASQFKLTFDDLVEFSKTKMEVNKKRKWGNPDKDGVVQHVEDKGEKEDEQTNFERTNACYGNHTGD